MSAVPDRIEKKVLLRAPLARVWRAVSDSREFGAWFGMRVEGPFVAGEKVRAAIVPTTVDEDVAAKQKPHEGIAFDIWVERVEPERLLSFRWHPYPVDPGADASAAPTTLVEFELTDGAGGVLLTITESGFDKIPLARRAEAFTSNEGGWATQATLIEKYLARAA
jgi:uncharacterized protein YndB with AHSA1/START domain